MTGGGTGGGTRDAGCVGITCPTGGGTGGGVTGGGGGAAITTLQAARTAVFPAKVNLQGVVVTAISFARASGSITLCAGTSTRGVNASFWVADPGNPQVGMWVEKFRCDADPDYFPQVGDLLNLSGVVGIESVFRQQDGYRVTVKSEYDFIANKPVGYVCALSSAPPCQPLIITRTGARSPLVPTPVPANFGGGGALQASPGFVGARVRIAGPLFVLDANPAVLHRISALPADNRYFGYALSNGVLVDNFRTFEGALLEDGGVSHCDVRDVVNDGGTVSFPNGLIGVWDTYTHAPCTDGGINLAACSNFPGMIAGTDAGYTHVLYPTDCADLQP